MNQPFGSYSEYTNENEKKEGGYIRGVNVKSSYKTLAS